MASHDGLSVPPFCTTIKWVSAYLNALREEPWTVHFVCLALLGFHFATIACALAI